MIPKPFTRVVLAVGEPVTVPADVPLDQLEPFRLAMQQALEALTDECRAALSSGRR